MLLALLMLVGLVVFILLVTWLTNKIFMSQTAQPVRLVDIGVGDDLTTGGMELEGVLMEEVGPETDIVEPSVTERLTAVTDAVAARADMLSDPALDDAVSGGKGGGSHGTGKGIGYGSGPGGFGMRRRWEVQFLKGNTVETYARQLDFFGIELGVLLPNNQVAYAYNLSKSKPDARTGQADQEKRCYLTWRKGELQAADMQLLGLAGISAQGRIILKFLPPPVEAQLAELEKGRAAGQKKKADRTLFGIMPQGKGFAFYVIDQTYR